MFPLLSSMTADLCCWVLVRALRVLKASVLLPGIIPFSVFLYYSLIRSIFAAFIFFLASLFTFLHSSPATALVHFCFFQLPSLVAQIQNLVCDPRLNRLPLSPKDLFSS